MMRKKGFTLVEIMIVVAIIALLAAIAIPNLLRARANANEAAGVAAVKTVVTAAISYRSVNPAYPTNLNALGSASPPYIDSILGCTSTYCNKAGFNFTLDGADANNFNITARPMTFGTTGSRNFFSNASGVLYYNSTSGGSIWTTLD